MAVWVMAHDWHSRRSRGFLMFVFLVSLTPQFVALWWLFPHEVTAAYQVGFVALPAVLAGSYLGLAIGNRLPREGLRRIVYVVLVLIALWSIASPLFGRTHDVVDGAPQSAAV